MLEHDHKKRNHFCGPSTKSSKEVFNLESPKIKSELEVSEGDKRKGREGKWLGLGLSQDEIMGQLPSLYRDVLEGKQ